MNIHQQVDKLINTEDVMNHIFVVNRSYTTSLMGDKYLLLGTLSSPFNSSCEENTNATPQFIETDIVSKV